MTVDGGRTQPVADWKQEILDEVELYNKLKAKYKPAEPYKVLDFWVKYHQQLPIHFLLACKTYSVLPTEANCERVFSFAGRVASALRTKLGSDMLEFLVRVPLRWDVHLQS